MKNALIKNLIGIAFILSVSTIQAQVVSTYELTLEGAKKIMAEAVKYANENNAPGGAIAIVDSGGNLILLERLTGTFPAASEVSVGKARTGAMFRMESKKLEDAIIGGRGSLTTIGYNMLRGGLPIIYNGKVIGGIGVSGAASADQDVQIAQAAVKAKFN